MSGKAEHNQKGAPDKKIAEQTPSGSGNTPDKATQENPPTGGPPPVPGKEAKEKTPPAEKRNKRSATYLYLLILFGAAFFMLLLAYFVQQRNSETTISDLRDSMNLSREELMEEIDGLREEKTALEEQAGQLQEERDDLKKQLDELREQHAELTDDFSDQYKKVHGWQNFWELEESFLSRDYEACARTLQALANAGSLNLPDSDSALARMQEIYEALVEQGYLDEGAVPFLENPGIPESEAGAE